MNNIEERYLAHHGILGQKWGVRRYQNPDGTLTAAGRKRYGVEGERTAKQTTRRLNDLDQAMAFNVHKHNQADIALKKLSNKAKRKLAKGKELSERDMKKVEKNAKKMAEADAYLKEGQEETKRILNNLPDTMTFTEKPIMRYSQKGFDFITDHVQPMGTPLGAIDTFIPGTTHVQGTEYKVKAKSDKQKAREAAEKEKPVDNNVNKKESAFDRAERESNENARKVLKDKPAATKEEIRQSTNNVIKANKNTLAKSIANDMVKDLSRWSKSDPDYNYFNGKSESEIRKSIEGKLQKQLSDLAANNKYFDPWFSNDGTIEFGINGVSEYSDSAPMTIKYDPEKKKVVDFWYT